MTASRNLTTSELHGIFDVVGLSLPPSTKMNFTPHQVLREASLNDHCAQVMLLEV